MGGIIRRMSYAGSLAKAANQLKDQFWPLIKSRQTFLLTLTGAAGYLCQPPAPLNWLRFAGLAGSLLVTICGCTILNMVFDRDIDRKMKRTSQRPLAANQVDVRPAATLGSILIVLGLVWALSLSQLYCLLILTGAGLDVVVYTVWLKRRSAWSIILGGLAGGMPILAGRALATSRIDAAGLLLALAVVCWIPSHNLTLATLYSEDYLNAGIPTFLSTYGLAATRIGVALSSVMTVLLTASAFYRLAFSPIVSAILGASGLGLVGMAFYGLARSSRQADGALYKYSSVYMLAVMLLLAFAAIR